MGGGMVSSPKPGGVYPVIGRSLFEGSNDTAEDITQWSDTELRKFMKWFIEVHHPEAVKQYQAIRAIERKADEAAKVEADLRMEELLNQYRKNQIQGMQNAYPYSITSNTTQQGYGIAVSTDPPRKSVWDRMKEMAGYK